MRRAGWNRSRMVTESRSRAETPLRTQVPMWDGRSPLLSGSDPSGIARTTLGSSTPMVARSGRLGRWCGSMAVETPAHRTTVMVAVPTRQIAHARCTGHARRRAVGAGRELERCRRTRGQTVRCGQHRAGCREHDNDTPGGFRATPAPSPGRTSGSIIVRPKAGPRARPVGGRCPPTRLLRDAMVKSGDAGRVGAESICRLVRCSDAAW